MLIKPVMPVFEYILNYDYIANVLCENKDKPELHCNGKCHLMKELAKASEDEKPASQKRAGIQTAEVLFCQPLVDFTFCRDLTTISNKNTLAYHNLYALLKETDVFHPPALIV